MYLATAPATSSNHRRAPTMMQMITGRGGWWLMRPNDHNWIEKKKYNCQYIISLLILFKLVILKRIMNYTYYIIHCLSPQILSCKKVQ